MRWIAAGLLAAGLAAQERTYENLNAVLWVQTSAEYASGTRQTYRAAEARLEAALQDPHWTAALEQKGTFASLPEAVVLDLDETVLDNSAFQARLVKEGKPFTGAAWGKWVAEARAGAVPGAVEFLIAAQARGVAPFFVTNRECDPANEADPTVRTLRRLAIPYASDRLLCKEPENRTGDKGARRAKVAAQYRIVLLLGDDFGDFLSVPPEQGTVAGRAELARAYQRMFGDRWFVLPNPTYGSWERAVGFDVANKERALRVD